MTDDPFAALFGDEGSSDPDKDSAGGDPFAGGIDDGGSADEAGREILNQQEIDALLEAITSGEVVESPDVGETEIRRTDRYSLYDFKRPERVSRDQLRSISTLHDVFARNFQAALSGMLRTITDVRVEAVDQLTYSEFIMNLQNPTCFSLVSCEPLEGSIIFEMNLAIVFPIINRLLGGGRIEDAPPDRPLTSIEWQLVRKLLEKALNALEQEWRTVVDDIVFDITATENNPQLMPIMSTNEPVVQVCFETFLGDKRGFFNVCYPVVTLEPVMEDISTQSWFGGIRRDVQQDVGGPNIEDALQGAPLEVEAVLAETNITVGELLKLKPGDILKTDHTTDEPLRLHVEGRPKYYGFPGQIRDRGAVRLTGLIPEDDLMKEAH
jgi:flagellar motor switch protein FliM